MKDKIIKTGLELLKQRNNRSNDLNILKQYLPPITRLFFEYYNTGNNDIMFDNSDIVILDNIGECGVAIDVWFQGKLINGVPYKDSFSHLLSNEDIMLEFEMQKSEPEIWHEKGMIKIGMMSHWDIILLGIEDSNKDVIYVYGEGAYLGDIHKFCDNIFELFSSVTRYYSDDDLMGYTNSRITGENIYKNWGEDFWRVRE